MTKQSSEIKIDSENKSQISLWLDHMVEPSTLKSFLEFCTDLLANEKSNEVISRMANEVAVTADRLWMDIKSDHPKYDCSKGCSWCCHQNVSVTWPELLKICNHLRQNLDTTEIFDLKIQSDKRAKEIAGKSTSERFEQQIACLFLEGNICKVHSARPLQCRGGFSEEESYCRNLLQDTKNTQQAVKDGRLRGKFLIAPKLIYNSAQVAMTSAMKEAGMDGSAYELTVAISILLTKLCNGEVDTLVEDDLLPALLKQNIDGNMATPKVNL